MALLKFIASTAAFVLFMFYVGDGFNVGWTSDLTVVLCATYICLGLLSFWSNLAYIRNDIESTDHSKLIKLIAYTGYLLANVILWYFATIFTLIVQRK